jgi:L-alanine-DL-glutamate epimerase-like enolase superfamily enzyme
MTPTLTVKDIRLSERQMAFSHPFRFGDVTVTSAPQLFVHVEIETEGERSLGATAELMVPKWFDKNPALSVDDTVEELRRSVAIARDLYLAQTKPMSAFALHAAAYPKQLKACAAAGMPQLPALYGPAEIDKAILDALLRALGFNLYEGLARNVMGLDARLTPDLDQGAIRSFLASRQRPDSVNVRHTVGMVDPVDSLRAVSAETGCRYFKIKLCGDPARDIARLVELASVLNGLAVDYRATLDANEQYAEPTKLATLIAEMTASDHLRQFCERLLYIEQPLPRELTWTTPLGDVARRFAFIVDEADDGYDAFPRALALGYRGISSKSCKGLYKSLLNGARAAAVEGRFISGEDLTCQAGLAVQQDTALAAYIGCTHIERNGHHYVDGFAGAPEAQAFLGAHPDLYEQHDGGVRLKISDGRLTLGSLAVPGFASGVAPEAIASSSTTELRIKEYAT